MALARAAAFSATLARASASLTRLLASASARSCPSWNLRHNKRTHQRQRGNGYTHPLD